MKTTLSVSFPSRYAAKIRRLRKTGRYQSNGEVVRAALDQLEKSEWDPNAYPPGSLAHLYTPARNREELELNKVMHLRVDQED